MTLWIAPVKQHLQCRLFNIIGFAILYLYSVVLILFFIFHLPYHVLNPDFNKITKINKIKLKTQNNLDNPINLTKIKVQTLFFILLQIVSCFKSALQMPLNGESYLLNFCKYSTIFISIIAIAFLLAK
jgi:hypothetical protein